MKILLPEEGGDTEDGGSKVQVDTVQDDSLPDEDVTPSRVLPRTQSHPPPYGHPCPCSLHVPFPWLFQKHGPLPLGLPATGAPAQCHVQWMNLPAPQCTLHRSGLGDSAGPTPTQPISGPLPRSSARPDPLPPLAPSMPSYPGSGDHRPDRQGGGSGRPNDPGRGPCRGDHPHRGEHHELRWGFRRAGGTAAVQLCVCPSGGVAPPRLALMGLGLGPGATPLRVACGPPPAWPPPDLWYGPMLAPKCLRGGATTVQACATPRGCARTGWNVGQEPWTTQFLRLGQWWPIFGHRRRCCAHFRSDGYRVAGCGGKSGSGQTKRTPPARGQVPTPRYLAPYVPTSLGMYLTGSGYRGR